MAGGPVVLDCDPGHDDVVAILHAHRGLEIAAITTVAGNAPLAEVTANALAITEAAGIGVPVFVGAAGPIVGPTVTASYAHGRSGLDGAERPAFTRVPEPGRAVDHLLRLAERHAGSLRIAAVGPLTNVALALLLDPGFADAVAEVSVMGGAVGTGNITASAEFNFHADPVAARIVLESRLNLRVVGLEVTHTVGLREAEIARLRSSSGRLPRLLGDLQAFYLARGRERYGRDDAPQHDVLAVVPWMDEGAITYERCSGTVCTDAGPHWGMSVFDTRGRTDVTAPRNILLARAADRDRVVGAVMESLLSYG